MKNGENMTDTLKQFKEYLDKIKQYQYVGSLLYWDLDTKMPEQGFENNSAATTFFSTEAFKLSTAPELKELLNKLSADEEFNALDDNWKFIVKRMKREFERDERIPVDFYSEYVKANSESMFNWQIAKKNNDFSLFAPYLKKTIENKKKLIGYTHPDEEIYDALLGLYEEGMDSATIDRLFDDLKAELVPFVKAIAAKNKPENPKFDVKYDLNGERESEKYLLSYIGFDWTKGATGETEHPFTINWGSKDVRVTNHFREDSCIDPMFSAIHEGGHAIFEQNVNSELDFTAAGSCSYMGIHESQSRFYENILGRNINFWKPVYSDLQNIVKELKDVSLEEFYSEINRVKCDYIRTAADEVTYCLHIIVRYEIEKAIFRDGVDVDELPALWNKKMEEYLGIVPPTDVLGILQDMHWSDGSFGYFPSYLLGSIYDGMFLEAIEKEMGSIDTILAEGRIKDITKWLNEKIHQYGSTRIPKDIIENVCRSQVSSKPLMKYFKEKYTEIYDL